MRYPYHFWVYLLFGLVLWMFAVIGFVQVVRWAVEALR